MQKQERKREIMDTRVTGSGSFPCLFGWVEVLQQTPNKKLFSIQKCLNNLSGHIVYVCVRHKHTVGDTDRRWFTKLSDMCWYLIGCLAWWFTDLTDSELFNPVDANPNLFLLLSEQGPSFSIEIIYLGFLYFFVFFFFQCFCKKLQKNVRASV